MGCLRMSRVIYKYQVELFRQTFQVPGYPLVRSVDIQDDKICVWVEIERAMPSSYGLDIYVIGTGWEIPDTVTDYAGSVLVGRFVWHVYSSSYPIATPARPALKVTIDDAKIGVIPGNG